jgi:dTDP-4-amino-4,6-dideoxygalactose transaminase
MKFFDLALNERDTRAAMDAAYRRVMDSGWLILGPELEAFEAQFAASCGAAHAVGVGNGLDALTLALRAAGIGPGAEVIVPSHTFVATWLAIEAVGARPVPVEVDAVSYTIDPLAVAAAVTPATAAVIPVSLYGHAVDMDPIMQLAQRHGLFVLEDAAQSHGAAYRERPVGSLAHATAFSFYPTKNLGALGDAGAVVTDNPALAERLRVLRNYGSRRKNEHETAGVNSRLDELQAAFLRVRLGQLASANERRRSHAARYDVALKGLAELSTPVVQAWAHHVYHLYVIRSPDRDRLQAKLKGGDVETLIHYPTPCHLQPAFAHLGLKQGAFPVAEQLARSVLSLPMWPQMPETAAATIAEILAGPG